MENNHSQAHVEKEEVKVAEASTVAAPATKPDRFLPISIVIAAVLIGGSVIFSTLYHPGAQTPSGGNGGNTTGQQQPTPSPAAAMQLGSRDEVYGNPKAPVTIIEYGDYQCPFCTRFFTDTQPLIIANYVNAGKVKMIFRSFSFLGPESNAAALAAECAFDQQKLWAYHDALYQAKVDDEQKGGSENDGSLNRALFLRLAQKVGLDIAKFTACLDKNPHADDLAKSKTVASSAGVNSTPSFLINGTLVVGAQPYSEFQTIIDGLLKS